MEIDAHVIIGKLKQKIGDLILENLMLQTQLEILVKAAELQQAQPEVVNYYPEAQPDERNDEEHS